VLAGLAALVPFADDLTHPEAATHELAEVDAASDHVASGPSIGQVEALLAGQALQDLGQLVGRRFRVGEIVCEGDERCEPCKHVASLTSPHVLRYLAHSGLRATILEGGVIHVGDEVELIDEEVEEDGVLSTAHSAFGTSAEGGGIMEITQGSTAVRTRRLS
jgi:hypothetical protein